MRLDLSSLTNYAGLLNHLPMNFQRVPIVFTYCCLFWLDLSFLFIPYEVNIW